MHNHSLQDTTFLITGGTGFIGRPLVQMLASIGCRGYVLTRSAASQPLSRGLAAGQFRHCSDLHSLPERLPEVIINLAGENIAGKRWTSSRKLQLEQSRVGVTNQLLALYKHRQQVPQKLLSGSAVGIYGFDERKTPWAEGDDLSASPRSYSEQLCQEWESAARQFEVLGAEVCTLRIGPVLADGGGMIHQLRTPFLLGLGGPVGNGQQWLSWIHRHDLCRAILFLLNRPHLPRQANLVAPESVTNLHFVKALAAQWRRPALLPMPAWVVRILFGTMGDELLLKGQQVIPKVLNDLGFEFLYPRLELALSHLHNQ